MSTATPKEELKRKNKRGAEEDSREYSQPLKKRGIEVDESHNNNNNQKEEDEETFLPKGDELNMLRYQKRSMGIKIQEQSNLISELNSKVETFERKLDLQNSLLNSVNRVWDQMIKDCLSMLNKLESNSSNSMDISYPKPKFLELYTLSEGADKTLQIRCNETKSIVNKVVDEIMKEKTQANKILNLLRENSSQINIQQNILDEIEKLQQQNRQLDIYNEELESKSKENFSKIESLEGTILQIQEKLKENEHEIYSLKEKFDLEQRRKLRIESKYMELLDQIKNQKIETLVTEPISSTSSVSIKSENSSNNLAPFDQNAMKDLEELKILAQSRLKVIEKLHEEKLTLISEVQKWQREATYIPDERILKSRLYMEIYQQLSAEIEELRNRFGNMERELKQKESLIHQQKEKINTIMNENESLFNKLKDSEQKASRYRSARNQLQHTLDMRQSATTQTPSLKEFQQLLHFKEVELKKSKEMYHKLQEELSKSKNTKDDSKKEQGKLLGELALKNAELFELKSKFDELSKKCQELEEKEREYRAISEIFHAQAKDKRELKEVRISEQKLKDEIELLKTKISELESTTKLKEIEEKYQLEISTLKNDSILKLSKNEQLIEELRTELENQKNEAERFLSEIEVVGTYYEESQEQNKRLIQQLSEHQDVITQLTSDQMKKAQLENKYKEEKEVLIEKLAKLEQKCSLQNEAFEKSESRSKLLTEQLKKLNEDLKSLQISAEHLKRIVKENSHLRPKLELLEKEMTELSTKYAETIQKFEKEKMRCEKLQEELESQKRKYERDVKNVSSDILSQERIKSLEHKLNCGVCNDQPKSVIITRCYHMFCKPCVQKNLSVRSRKCPACGKPFGENDVHPIYF